MDVKKPIMSFKRNEKINKDESLSYLPQLKRMMEKKIPITPNKLAKSEEKEIKKQAKRIDKLITVLTEQQGFIEEVRAQVAQQEKALQEQTAEHSTLMHKQADDFAHLKDEIAATFTEIDRATASQLHDVTNCKKNIHLLVADSKKHTSTEQSLTTALGDLRNKIHGIERNTTGSQEEVQQLQEHIKTIHDNMQLLERRVGEATSTVSNTNADLAELRSREEALRAQCDELSRQTAAVKTKADSTADDILNILDSMSTEGDEKHARATERLEKIEQAYHTFTQNTHATESTLSALQSRISETQQSLQHQQQGAIAQVDALTQKLETLTIRTHGNEDAVVALMETVQEEMRNLVSPLEREITSLKKQLAERKAEPPIPAAPKKTPAKAKKTPAKVKTKKAPVRKTAVAEQAEKPKAKKKSKK